MGGAGYLRALPRGGVPPTPRIPRRIQVLQMSVSERDILAAMSKVMDPELHVDLVKAGMVKDIRLSGDAVKPQPRFFGPPPTGFT